MTQAPKHRWFSLRMLFVAVTLVAFVICALVGLMQWQRQIMHSVSWGPLHFLDGPPDDHRLSAWIITVVLVGAVLCSPLRPRKPPWFRFSLRTLFAVVAILAWALATRPYLVPVWHWAPERIENGEIVRVNGRLRTETLFGKTFFLDLEPDERGWGEEFGLNPNLRWPLITLASFVGWETTRRVWAWRAERSATTTTQV